MKMNGRYGIFLISGILFNDHPSCHKTVAFEIPLKLYEHTLFQIRKIGLLHVNVTAIPLNNPVFRLCFLQKLHWNFPCILLVQYGNCSVFIQNRGLNQNHTILLRVLHLSAKMLRFL